MTGVLPGFLATEGLGLGRVSPIPRAKQGRNRGAFARFAGRAFCPSPHTLSQSLTVAAVNCVRDGQEEREP